MIAWAGSNPGILDNERAIADFLSRQASPLSFDAEALRTSLKALFSWISSTWPGSELCAEYPVCARLDNGQRVVGRIDLLISTADGLVVMDHKLAGTADVIVQSREVDGQRIIANEMGKVDSTSMTDISIVGPCRRCSTVLPRSLR